jgi:hypothetical protein
VVIMCTQGSAWQTELGAGRTGGGGVTQRVDDRERCTGVQLLQYKLGSLSTDIYRGPDDQRAKGSGINQELATTDQGFSRRLFQGQRKKVTEGKRTKGHDITVQRRI